MLWKWPLKSTFSIIHISSVLSLQSSRSQRRQFSTMMTVRAQRYQQAARYKIHNITYMFNINIIHNILVTYSISMTSTISTDLENACRLTGSWMPWCARTPSTSPPSLRGLPNMSQTRINLELLFVGTYKSKLYKSCQPRQSWFLVTYKSKPPTLKGLPDMSRDQDQS